MILRKDDDTFILAEFPGREVEDDGLSDLAWRLVTAWAKREFHVTNCELRETETGKKYFKHHGDVFFNVSHTEGCVAIAIRKGGEIGIDVEAVKNISEKVQERFYGENEKRRIRASDDPGREATRIWTRKEAYAKCTGEGLNRRTLAMDTAGDQFEVFSGKAVNGFGRAAFVFETYEIDQFIVTACHAR